MSQIIFIIITMAILGGGFSLATSTYMQSQIIVEKIDSTINQEKDFKASLERFCLKNAPVSTYPILSDLDIVKSGYTTKNPFEESYSLEFLDGIKVKIKSNIPTENQFRYTETFKNEYFGGKPTCSGIQCEQIVFLKESCD
jgi:hypothetical protein